MTKPLYFWNGTTFELVGPTTPQSPFAYQTSAPTAPATGDIWIDSDGDVDTYNRQLTRYYFVATAGQTSVSGTDANGLTLAYVAGSEAVYVNGALQVRGVDYTATNGTSITGLSALALNDVVEVFAYTAFTVANAYTKTETDSLVGVASGLKLLTPSSIAVGSGTGSVNASGSVTFSGASSLSLNDVFSATYDNYLILLNAKASASNAVNVRLRASGSDATNSTYNYQFLTANSTTVSGSRSNTQTSWDTGDLDTTEKVNSIYIYNPYISGVITSMAVSPSISWVADTNSNPSIGLIGGSFTTTGTAYTGCSLIMAGGTMTGTLCVYGFKD